MNYKLDHREPKIKRILEGYLNMGQYPINTSILILDEIIFLSIFN
jgi:hypothetical protein